MIDNGVIQYQIDNPEELMEKFYQGGNEILLALRNYVTSPENRKKPRTWGTIEAAKMVGVSDPTFRKLLENNQTKSFYNFFLYCCFRLIITSTCFYIRSCMIL